MQLRIQKEHRRSLAFTLVEVVVSSAVAAVIIAGCVAGYVLSARRAEWSAYSLAANSHAVMRLEQCRAAKWDPMSYPPVDELVAGNFPPQTNLLDVPISGDRLPYATNFTTITEVSQNPPLKMIRIECHGPFARTRHFTNVVVTYRSPDQ